MTSKTTLYGTQRNNPPSARVGGITERKVKPPRTLANRIICCRLYDNIEIIKDFVKTKNVKMEENTDTK